jgi:hypothetical protein
MTLATVPGEPTTEVGRRLEGVVGGGGSAGVVAIGALGDEYVSYVTTPEEYGAQHYEGGSTLYGPSTLAFYEGGVHDLARAPGELKDFEELRKYEPGLRKNLLPTRKCERGRPYARGKPSITCDEQRRLHAAELLWGTAGDIRSCPLPKARIECDGKVLVGRLSQDENDEWINFEVLRQSRKRWTARWTALDPVEAESCRIVVKLSGENELSSSSFSCR